MLANFCRTLSTLKSTPVTRMSRIISFVGTEEAIVVTLALVDEVLALVIVLPVVVFFIFVVTVGVV